MTPTRRSSSAPIRSSICREQAAERLRAIPVVSVDARDTTTADAARVAFTTAAPGVHRPGVVHRLDGVPVPLRALLASSRPSDEEVLGAIAGRLAGAGGAGVTLRIAGGRVYDPANGVAGEVRDVCLSDGKVVDDVPAHAARIDARGMVVMPGGVDIHAHIAGPKVNAARRLAPEEHRGDVVERSAIMRSGTGGTVPSTFVTGYRYALLGYTTVVEAATPPLAARHVLAELRDTPMIDAAFLAADGQQRGAVRPDPPRPGARARRDRLVAGGDGRLRGQARQPGRRRTLEARRRQRQLETETRPGVCFGSDPASLAHHPASYGGCPPAAGKKRDGPFRVRP